MSVLWPSAAEAQSLRFLLPLGGLRQRVVLAAVLFLAGIAIWVLAPPLLSTFGLPVILLGHLPLWVRRLKTAPGGATPAHEEVWVPTDDDWLDRVTELEERGKKWDASLWDVSNTRGCLLLVLGSLGGGFVLLFSGALVGGDGAARLIFGAGVIFLPIWLNGIRTLWNPSELRLKGESLGVARSVAEVNAAGELEPVPLLAVREGKRGKYPVDARLMLRPVEDKGDGFLGVQVQVALNNVRGTDYPYLYCVVLGKTGFRLRSPKERKVEGVRMRLVFENGTGDGASFLVVRRHADRSGGWHTRSEHIEALVRISIDLARQARRENAEENG